MSRGEVPNRWPAFLLKSCLGALELRCQLYHQLVFAFQEPSKLQSHGIWVHGSNRYLSQCSTRNASLPFMPDVVDQETRSRMMAGIRGKNTEPELLLRRALHARGFRYLLHDARLPGKPDLVFPKRRAIIQVHGCFWHCHNCHLFKWPSSRIDFWHSKITRNKENDAEVSRALVRAGWRILTVWECALKGRTRLPFDRVADVAVTWLVSGKSNLSLQGSNNAKSG